MRKLIGDKKFYMMVLAVSVPIMIQNAITNFVSLLDNIMVGRIGTEQMSGVAITNQLMFVYNLCIFGAVSGASIFGAQFYGKRDFKGMRDTFRFRFIVGILIAAVGVVVFMTMGEPLIRLYLEGSTDVGDAELTYSYAQEYLKVMIIGLLPFTMAQIYSSTLREMGETFVPMLSGIIAVIINLILNYILIFGKFGAPELGVVGAAIATIVSRFIECFIIMIWTHTHTQKYPFIIGAYKSLRVPSALAKQIIIKGSPLLINEALWASGMATLMQCYSLRGLEVIAAMNISSTISNLFNIVFLSLGSSISIIVGPMLGADNMQEAKQTVPKLISFSVFVCLFFGFIMAALSHVFPQLYNTEEVVRNLASSFIIVAACCMPLYAFMHATYFTLRTGGKTIVTFLFDSVFLWVVSIPLAKLLALYTDFPIVPLYLSCQLVEIIKCTIGFILVKKGVWLNNIVNKTESQKIETK